MLIDLHLAETAIKAGDTKTGFDILREILAALTLTTSLPWMPWRI